MESIQILCVGKKKAILEKFLESERSPGASASFQNLFRTTVREKKEETVKGDLIVKVAHLH